MKPGKYKCSCGLRWLGYDECPDGDGDTHIIKPQRLLADDYAELWSIDLEDANRHDSTGMPSQILGTLEKHIKDKKVITKIMKSLYDNGIGL